MNDAWISSPLGILATLAGVAWLFHMLEHRTGWKLFHVFPPLLFVYALPLAGSNTGILANDSPLYGWMDDVVLPMFLVILLLDIDFLATVRIMGRGMLVFLFGTAGVVIGAPVAYLVVKQGLGPESWKGFGALAGSWIGGTANMAAVSGGLETPPAEFGLAVLTDALVYCTWIPILLVSRAFAGAFHAFTRVDPDRIAQLERASDQLFRKRGEIEMRHVLSLLFLGLFFPWLAGELAERLLPEVSPVLTTDSWKILLTTTFGVLLSMTPARRIPGSRAVASALVVLFVAKMGASANLGDMAERAPAYLLAAPIWIGIHGAFCVAGAKLFRVDVHSAAIASAANIGGVATGPIVAAYHNPKLVPVSILMALTGYAIGTYGAFLAAWLCYLIS